MPNKKSNIQQRDLQFTHKSTTRISQEIPSRQNEYLTEYLHCHGYELLDLASKRSFIDVLYLLFLGEIPSKNAAHLLEKLMIACINPGPRHPATRAAMNAGVSRTRPEHFLPISLLILGGGHLGGKEVMDAMHFLHQNRGASPEDIVNANNCPIKEGEGEYHLVPGFGRRFGGIDPYARRVADMLLPLPGAGKSLAWGNRLAQHLATDNLGWLLPGVIAATLQDLGFDWKTGAGLMQIFSSPGLLAHGCEMASQPITAMPFPDKNHYIISNAAKKK